MDKEKLFKYLTEALENAYERENMDELVKVDGLNWQRCEDGHKLILHRERLCPMCEFKFIAQDSMKKCFIEVFGEEKE